MSSLQALQQKMLQAVLSEITPTLSELRGDERADAATRMDIYRHGYRVRLREALAVEYPGLALMAGRSFATLLENYLEAHPSGHYNIRWHGAGLAAFLDYGLPWRDKPAMADMARLDWAISTVFDAPDEPVLGMADMAAIPPTAWPTLVLEPQQHVQIFSTPHNVEVFRRAADQELMRPRLRRYGKTRHLLIWRHELTVRYRTMDDDELAVLTQAVAGKTFAELCECLGDAQDEGAAMTRLAQLLHDWVASGLLRGYRLD